MHLLGNSMVQPMSFSHVVVVANLLLLHQHWVLTFVFGSQMLGGSSGVHVLKWKAKEEGTATLFLGWRSVPIWCNSVQMWFWSLVAIKRPMQLCRLTLPDCWKRQSFFMIHFGLVSGRSSPDFLGSFCSTSKLRLAQRHIFCPCKKPMTITTWLVVIKA